MADKVYDRTTEDVGNIVEFGHVNVRVPDLPAGDYPVIADTGEKMP